MKPVRAATFAHATPRGALFALGDGLTCRLSFLAPDLARVTFLRGETAVQRRTWMVPAYGEDDVPFEGRDRLDETSWPAVSVEVTQGEGSVSVASAALRVSADLRDFSLAWSLPDGSVVAADRDKHAYAFGSRAIRHAFIRAEGERYYGLGDKTGPLDHAGRRLRTTMMDSLGVDPERGDPLYKHWPFLIVRNGERSHGVFYDTMAEATFDLGQERDNYYGAYRATEFVGGDLDYYLFVGSDPLDVTRAFLRLTGRPALPPRWTLGFAQTAMAIADADDAQSQMERFIARCAEHDIPVSAFHFGSGYTTIGPRRYVFTWNRSKYPQPAALMRQFHEAGIHVVANVKPCLLDDHPRYDEPAGAYVAEAGGGPAISQFWDGEGAHLDFTHPDAIAWWRRGLRETVLGEGMDVAWNDNNEYGFWNEHAVCDGFGEPIPLDLARPLQPLLMTRASVEEQRAQAPGQRVFSVTRAGCPGLQRYAQTWSGDNLTDWRALRWSIAQGLTMSLSGMGNTGHDIGGFAGPVPDAELLIRWTQAGVVNPRMIMNSWKPGGVYTAPWLHPDAIPLVREAIRLRYRLLPYLYSLMHEAHADGTPPLRPVAFSTEGPDEDRAAMLGPFLLAIPATAPGARSVEVRLPVGLWFDFHTGEAIGGGGAVTVAAPLDRLPLLCPAGAIVPMTDSGSDFSRRHDEITRRLHLFPGRDSGHSRFVLFEDDGLTDRGPVTCVTIEMTWTDEAVDVAARSEGDYPLPYETIAVRLRSGDLRKLRLSGPLRADDEAARA